VSLRFAARLRLRPFRAVKFDEVPEEVLDDAGSEPQALKRRSILSESAARVELVPFPFVGRVKFFCSLL
jgi:hypothetical protein